MLPKLTPINDAQGVYANNVDNMGDLTSSASDRSKYNNISFRIVPLYHLLHLFIDILVKIIVIYG